MSPYPPPAFGAPQIPPPHGYGPPPAPLAWSVGEVITEAWEAFRAQWRALFGAYFFVGAVCGIPEQIPSALAAAHVIDKSTPFYWGTTAAATLLGMSLQMVFQGGLVRMWLTAVRGGNVEFGMVFSGVARSGAMLAQLWLFLLAAGVGYVFCVVPGVLIALALTLTQFFMVDQDLGPIAAMRASYEATRGQLGPLFLLNLAGVAIMTAGFLACCVGMYAAIPVFFMALAIVYDRLTGRTRGAPVDVAYGYAAPAPPGGDAPYGGPGF